MKKKIAIAAVFAAIILAPFVWMWINRNGDAEIDIVAFEDAGGGETPPVSESVEMEPAPETTDVIRIEIPTEISGETAPADAFAGWEDAYDEFARRVGLEYDRQVAAGEKNATLRAYEVVQEQMVNDAEFLAAMSPYIPYTNPVGEADADQRIPNYLWNPMSVLLRSGRTLEDRYYDHTTLANGEVYKHLPHQELHVTWRKRRAPKTESEQGRKEVQRVLELIKVQEKRIASATSAAQKDANQKNLEALQFVLDKWTEETISEHKDIISPGPSVPDYDKEIIEIDLGLVEKTSPPPRSD